jgi:hypothetical protein
MKRITILISIIAILATACGKDNVVNPEKALFKRLSANGGVWDLEKIEEYTFDNQGNETLANTTVPSLGTQYVFYEHSEIFDYAEQMDLSYLAVAVLTKDQGGIRYALWAENNRIIFEDYGIILGPQITYTVRENKSNKQVWEVYTTGTFKRKVYYLKHCPNCEPYFPNYQAGGI